MEGEERLEEELQVKEVRRRIGKRGYQKMEEEERLEDELQIKEVRRRIIGKRGDGERGEVRRKRRRRNERF